MARKKKPADPAKAAAALLGSRGGKKKVPKGLAKVDPEKQAAIVRAGAKARWEKFYRENPEKRPAK